MEVRVGKDLEDDLVHGNAEHVADEAEEQVMNLAKTSIVQKAWKNSKSPDLHGWVYGLKDGLIKPVYEIPAGTALDPLYEFDDL